MKLLLHGMYFVVLVFLFTNDSIDINRITDDRNNSGDLVDYLRPEKRQAKITEKEKLTPADRQHLIQSYGRLPLTFEANHGQTTSNVKFLSRGNGYMLQLTSEEAILTLRNSFQNNNDSNLNSSLNRTDLKASEVSAISVLSIKLVGANNKAIISGLEQQPGRTSYLIGENPDKWHNNISSYARVRYENVYSGIDLVYYGNQQQLEYDFIVEPGYDPETIQIEFSGAKKLYLDDNGNAVIHTANGELIQHKPIVYQEDNQKRVFIDGKYVLIDDNKLAFAVADYNNKIPLVIDPILVYSTFIGGSGNDTGRNIAVDNSGCAYIFGYTGSANFPTSPGAYDITINSSMDYFVAKMNPDGTNLVYSTFLEATSALYNIPSGGSIAVDDNGSAYVTYNKGSLIKVAKLTPDGGSLVYSKSLGGNNELRVGGIAIDNNGQAYITGYTNGANFTTTPGAFNEYFSGGYDIFVTKVTSDGSGLIYSTFVGGENDERATDIAVDNEGYAYVTGYNSGGNFPVTDGALSDGVIGQIDGVIFKLLPDGSDLAFSTYFGGSKDERPVAIRVDSERNIYVAGMLMDGGAWDREIDFPTTEGAFDETFNGGSSDGFLLKLTADGSNVIYSTFFGGNGSDQLWDMAIDINGCAYLTGSTEPNRFNPDPFYFPITSDAFDNSLGGFQDGYLSKISQDGSNLEYSTFLGGEAEEYGYSVAASNDSCVYVTGFTNSSLFPTTTGSFDQSFNGSYDAWVVKFGVGESNHPPLAKCQNVTISADVNCQALVTASQVDNGSSDPDGDPLSLSLSPSGPYMLGDTQVTLNVSDGKIASQCIAIITVVDNVPPVSICHDEVIYLNAEGRASITPETINNNSYDACGIKQLSLDKSVFTFSDIGPNIVVLTVTDNNNNTSTCNSIVTVRDTIPPIAVCQDVTIVLDAFGNGILTAEAVNNGSYDACGIKSISIDKTLFTCVDVGSNEVVLTVIDNNNNTSTCNSIVTVKDIIPPVAICQDVTVYLDANGTGTAFAESANNGSYDACGIKSLTLDKSTFSCSDIGPNNVVLTVTDNNNNYSTCNVIVTVINDTPEITGVVGPEQPVSLGNMISLIIRFNDLNASNVNVKWGDGMESDFGTPGNTIFTEHLFDNPGVYSVTVTLTDVCNQIDIYHYKYVVIYDPTGGFVTGGGWIESPEGAYKPDLSLIGKANFGFVAKYKKGSTIPDGNTEFQFSAGNLNFRSLSYYDMRLVIAGARANYKGEGVINGTGQYGFMVSAVDGEINGGGGIDKFRIKIWDLNTSAVIYDNNITETDDNAEPATAIGGGSIVFHSEDTKSGETNPLNKTNSDGLMLLVFPNPFNEILKFEFIAPVDGLARIDLYDISGRLLNTVFESKVQKGESYNAEFKPVTAPGGILIYRMKLGDKVFNGIVLYEK